MFLKTFLILYICQESYYFIVFVPSNKLHNMQDYFIIDIYCKYPKPYNVCWLLMKKYSQVHVFHMHMFIWQLVIDPVYSGGGTMVVKILDIRLSFLALLLLVPKL